MEGKKAAFMGKITAGVTHEMKNVLAIIKESAGLMEDLMALDKGDSLPHKEKFLRSLSRIADQVARGVDLSTRLNLFAHAPDNLKASVDLNQAIGQTAFICHRAANSKGMKVQAVPHERPVVVTTDPLGLQMLLFQCVGELMEVVDSGSIITLQPTRDKEPVVVVSKSEESSASGPQGAYFETTSPQWQELQLLAGSLQASIEAGRGAVPGIFVRFSADRS
jgi:nitrogen fixation/metabolism regulation signal transduction histidine kinase